MRLGIFCIRWRARRNSKRSVRALVALAARRHAGLGTTRTCEVEASEDCFDGLLYLEDDQGSVVGGVLAAGVDVDFFKNFVGQAVGGHAVVLRDDL
jgi:hypothetical protein